MLPGPSAPFASGVQQIAKGQKTLRRRSRLVQRDLAANGLPEAVVSRQHSIAPRSSPSIKPQNAMFNPGPR